MSRVLQRREWTEAELKYALSRQGQDNYIAIARHLNRSRQDVMTKICVTMHEWTDEQKDVLRRDYKTKGCDYVAAALNKSKQSVLNMAHKLGCSEKLEAWTRKEIEYLKANHGLISYRQIARDLGKTHNAVKAKRLRLGLRKATGKMQQTLHRKERQKTTDRQVPEHLRPQLYMFLRAIKKGLRLPYSGMPKFGEEHPHAHSNPTVDGNGKEKPYGASEGMI